MQLICTEAKQFGFEPRQMIIALAQVTNRHPVEIPTAQDGATTFPATRLVGISIAGRTAGVPFLGSEFGEIQGSLRRNVLYRKIASRLILG